MTDRRRPNPDPSETEPEESFFTRWSRRKREAGHRGERREPAAPAEAPGAETPQAAEPEPTDTDLPPAESLGPDSDYSGYLSSRVSEELRRAALRRLFRLPQFNVRDGLDDYDEDYRSFTALGETITADMRHHQQRLREKAARREAEAGRVAGEGTPAEPRAGASEPDAAQHEPTEDHTAAHRGHPQAPDADDPEEDTPDA